MAAPSSTTMPSSGNSTAAPARRRETVPARADTESLRQRPRSGTARPPTELRAGWRVPRSTSPRPEAHRPVEGGRRLRPLPQRPVGGFDNRVVQDAAAARDVLEIIRQRPQAAPRHGVDRRGRDDGVVVVNELRQRVVELARAALEHGVGVTDLVGPRRVVENREHAARRRCRADCRDTRGRGPGGAHRRARWRSAPRPSSIL